MRVLATLADCSATPNLTQQPTQNNHQRAKINDSLKPFKLTQENNPVELRNWLKQFRAFYTTSRLDTLDVENQQAYFRICIDAALEEKLFPLIDTNTPIFGNGGCLELIEDEFAKSYPLVKRRNEYYGLKHESGQKFSEFASKLLRLGAEADLGNLGIDDMHVFRYMQACSDTKLRDKFLELTDPTLQRLNAIVAAYESAKATSSAFDSKNYAVNQVRTNQTSQQQGPRQSQQGQRQGSNPPRAQNQHSQGQNASSSRIPEQCSGCGAKPAHPRRSDCPMANTECRFCKRVGHVERMCRSKKRAMADNGNSNNNNNNSNRPRGPAKVNQAHRPHPPTPQRHRRRLRERQSHVLRI